MPEHDMAGRKLPQGLRALQTEFAAHIRDPEVNAPPADVEDRRMKIYRELFFSNISSMLSSNFPVLKTLYDDGRWQRLIRDFYSEHRCQTPLFPELPKEFLRYLQDHRGAREGDPPFLLELAHYEWVELALQLDERELESVAADRSGDLVEGIPMLSPLAWPLSYRYPVHRIKPDFQPTEPPEEATHLLVYRDREDDVKFMELNDVTRYLLQLLASGGERSGRELLLEVAAEIRHPDPERLLPAGRELMEDLRRRGVLLGTRENPNV